MLIAYCGCYAGSYYVDMQICVLRMQNCVLHVQICQKGRSQYANVCAPPGVHNEFIHAA